MQQDSYPKPATQSEKCFPLIISYNNPGVLRRTVYKLLSIGFDIKSLTIYDNGSSVDVNRQIRVLTQRAGIRLINSPTNRGWGGAINNFLDDHISHDQREGILLIMAHDSYFVSIDLAEVFGFFEDAMAIFVCPAYPHPLTNHYSIFKSYYSRPGVAKGRIKIGQQTAFFARASLLKLIRYDEEFWLYGDEYEIFTRASQAGFHTYVAPRSVVVNPGSDSSTVYAYLSYKLNSLYCAYKRHGYLGLALRSLVIIYNIIGLFAVGDRFRALCLARCLLFALENPGHGVRTYRKSQAHQTKYPIPPLFRQNG
jgi:GT2 family glycosyltransferase